MVAGVTPATRAPQRPIRSFVSSKERPRPDELHLVLAASIWLNSCSLTSRPRSSERTLMAMAPASLTATDGASGSTTST
eukprot:scaffold1714_cov111-Isochrysis_galbana.AAC.7